MRILQKGINDLRTASNMIGARFSFEQEQTSFIEALQLEISTFIEALQPDYPLLFSADIPKGLKAFIGLNKSLIKTAKTIRKILTKEETPENAWRRLQTQLVNLQNEVQSL